MEMFRVRVSRMGIKDIYVKTNHTNQAIISKSSLGLLLWFKISLDTYTLIHKLWSLYYALQKQGHVVYNVSSDAFLKPHYGWRHKF